MYSRKSPRAQWSLGAIIRGFKIGVTKYANTHNIPFTRQWRYHDCTNFFKKLALKLYKSFSIVRDQYAYDRIKYYIQQNPKRRKKDCFSEETHYS